jgi:hypothetical protein
MNVDNTVAGIGHSKRRVQTERAQMCRIIIKT